MKHTLKAVTRKKHSYLLLFLTGLTFVTACKKHDDYDFDSTVSANVRLVNTSTDAGPSQLYMSDVLRTQNAVNFGTSSDYNQTYVGQVDANVKSANGTVLATANTQVDAQNNYTFLLTGTSGSYSLITLHDDTQAAASGKAKVRFVQAASGIVSANLLSNGAALFTALAFKAVSDYNEVNAGAYVFAVTNTGSNNSLASSASVTLQAGKNYTVYTYGVSGGSGTSALGVNVLVNN